MKVPIENVGMTVYDVAVCELSRLIGHRGSAQSDIDVAREQARSGNPFPLIAMQWPELIIHDEQDGQYFEGIVGDRDDPCLRLDYWQRNDIIKSIFDDSYFSVLVKGCTKAGKGASTAIAINLWFDVYEESKVIITSSRYQHAVDVLFGEVARWRRRMSNPGPGTLLRAGLVHTEQHYIAVSNPETGEGFSGQHGPRTMFVFDEASGIAKSFFMDAEKQARKMVALLNPRTLSGWAHDGYADCHPKDVTQDVQTPMGKRRCVTVSGADCLNVKQRRLEMPVAPTGGITIDRRRYAASAAIPLVDFVKVKTLIPEQIDFSRFLGIMSHPDKRHSSVFGLGKFPTEDPEKQVVLPSWVALGNSKWMELGGDFPVAAFGLDVQRSLDGDDTTLSAFGFSGCGWLCSWKYNDLKYHAKRAIDEIRERAGIDLRGSRHPIAVDCDGLGVGAADELKSQGAWVIEIHGGASSQFKTYGNLRAEMYAMAGRRLNPDDRLGCDEDCAVPVDDQLAEELTAPEKIPVGKDAFRWRLQSKDEVKAKIGRSPDRADSYVYGFHAWRQYEEWSRYRSASQSAVLIHTTSVDDSVSDSPKEVKASIPDWMK